MKTWEVKDLGLDNLTLTEKNIRSIADDEVLVEMKAASLNYRDLIMIDGGYGPIGGKPPFIPISDGAGVVKEVGKSIKNFKVSDVVKNLVRESIIPAINAGKARIKYHTGRRFFKKPHCL